MAERWFSDEELTELSRPTMDRAIEAIEAGDLERAKALCEEMKHEWRFLHDLMVDGIAGSTDLTGQFNVVRAAFEALRESGDGRVVVVSSASAETGLPGQVAYTAAKAGLVGMARTLAAEWGRHGIRCNVVMPGLIATPKVLALPEPVRSALSAVLPLGRVGEPAELAASREARRRAQGRR